MKKTLQERFDEKYAMDSDTGCWLWTASTNRAGYGQIQVARKVRGAHRVSYELHIGPIPEGEGAHGTCVLHRCDVRRCVNPDHLFLGSNIDNAQDMSRKGRAPRGQANGQAKLTEQQALEIRADTRTGRAIATDYGISKTAVHLIKTRQSWAHLPDHVIRRSNGNLAEAVAEAKEVAKSLETALTQAGYPE